MTRLQVIFDKEVIAADCLDFQSTPASFTSERILDLVPVQVSNTQPDMGTMVIKANPLEPSDAVCDKFESTYFRSTVDNERLLLKFGSGEGARERIEIEAKKYLRLEALQGMIIATFKGLYTVSEDPSTICLITTDVGDSLKNGLLKLSIEDRVKIARLLRPLCNHSVRLPILDTYHILRTEDGNYRLHDLHDIEAHACQERYKDQESMVGPLFQEFKCGSVRYNLHIMRVWGWPGPHSVAIDNTEFSKTKFPPQVVINELWSPLMEGHIGFYYHWYKGIREYMDKENLDFKKDEDMKRIREFAKKQRDLKFHVR